MISTPDLTQLSLCGTVQLCRDVTAITVLESYQDNLTRIKWSPSLNDYPLQFNAQAKQPLQLELLHIL